MQPHDTTNDIPYGYCHCGCGQKTWIATKTSPGKNWIKGCPVKFAPGHGSKRPLLERFLKKLNKNGPTHPALGTPCWEWTGARRKKGYGMLRIDGKTCAAHRVSYELAFQKIPDGLSVLHRCDNPPCCNPAHLFLGTYADNAQDRERKGRSNTVRGSRQGSALLDEDKVREIRHRRASGELRRDLAKAFDVSIHCIDDIVHRKSWKHVK